MDLKCHAKRNKEKKLFKDDPIYEQYIGLECQYAVKMDLIGIEEVVLNITVIQLEYEACKIETELNLEDIFELIIPKGGVPCNLFDKGCYKNCYKDENIDPLSPLFENSNTEDEDKYTSLFYYIFNDIDPRSILFENSNTEDE